MLGSGEIKAVEQGAAAGNASVQQVLAYLQFGAAGMKVVGGVPGKDSVPAMLMPGELVVPTHMVKAGAVDHLRGRIPGFGAGGVVGAGAVASQLGKIVPTVEHANGAFAASAAHTFALAMQKALQGMLPSSGASTSAAVASVLAQALAITNTPASWLPALETMVMKESGGNASAVDPISVGGQHATGLLQELPSTFAMYAMPGHGNILNPLDNAIASIDYIKAAYGSPAAITGIGRPGTYQGYSAGGMISEPVFGYGAYSGMPYSFAERGPEQVIPGGAATVGAPGLPPATQYGQKTTNDLLQQVVKLLAQMPYTQAQAINQANASGVRRGWFATSG